MKMVRKKLKLVKRDNILIDKELYPRSSFNWQTSYDYSQSMMAGAKFPLITVAELRKKLYLVDGAHRLQALKTLKKDIIQVEILIGLTKKEIYLEAVKRNMVHGRQFSPYEKRRIIVNLRDMKFTVAKISEMVNIPVDKLDKFTYETITDSNTTGKPIVLKAPLKNLAVQNINEEVEELQSNLTTKSQEQLLDQVITIIEGDMLDLTNPKVKNRVAVLKKLFRKIKL